MAPEPDIPAPLDEDTARRPFVVTFYSFKGGVGLTQVGFFLAQPEKGEEEKRTGEYAHQVA